MLNVREATTNCSQISQIDDVNCNIDVTKCKSLNNIIIALNAYNKYKKKQLKDWMKEKNLWDESLYYQLKINNIYCIDQLNILSQKEINLILGTLKDNKISKNKYDALLIEFKKEWIKLKKNKIETGISYPK